MCKKISDLKSTAKHINNNSDHVGGRNYRFLTIDNDLIKVTHTTCNQGRVKSQGFLSPRLMLFNKLPTPIFLGFPYGSAGKESARNAGDLDLIPGLGRSPGEGKGYPLQYSGLENSMD